MPKVERGPQGLLLAAGLALATVGVASCQRPSDQAAIDTAVKATLTARSGMAEPAGTPGPFPRGREAPPQITTTKNPQTTEVVQSPPPKNEPIFLQSKRQPHLELLVPGAWKITSNSNPDINSPGIKSINQTELQISRTTLTSPEEAKTFEQLNRSWFVDLMKKQGYESLDESRKLVMSSPHPPRLRSGFSVAVGRIKHGSGERDLRAVMFRSKSSGWVFTLLVDPPKTSQEEQEFIQTMQGLYIADLAGQPPRAEAQKPAVEKQAIRLKPEELFRALLTTPLENNELPPGFTSKGKSAGTLDATAQALKAIGQVNVLVVTPDPRFSGMPSGGISYTVFPDASRAKDAYNMLAKRPDSRTISDSPYPTAFLIEQSPFAKVNVCIVWVDNTFIAATLTSIDQTPQETNTVQLARAGVKHLQRVGR